jgi:hypothetical protein
MTDPELFSHLMAEITARFEELAGEAANLQDPANATDDQLGLFCTAAEQASHLAQSARFLMPGPRADS